MQIDTLNTLCSHLQRLDAHVITNPESPTAVIRQFALACEPRNRDPETIYIVDMRDSSSRDALNTPGTYVVVGADEATGKKLKENGSNAILVDGPMDELVSLVEGFVKGVDLCIDASPKIVGAMIGNDVVHDCLEALAPAFENPIGLWASDMSLVYATSYEQTGDTVWDRMVVMGENPRDIAGDDVAEANNEVARSISYPSIQFNRAGMSHRTMVMSFLTTGNARYYLYGLECVREFRHEDKVILYALSLMLSKALPSVASVPTREERISALLSSILSGAMGEDKIAVNMRDLGISLGRQLLGTLIEPDNRESVYMSHPRSLRVIRKATPHALVTTYKSRIFVVTDRDSEQGSLDGKLRQLMSEGYRCSTSQPFFSMTDLRQAYDQCRAALQISRALGDTDKVARYEDYALLDLLRRAGKHFNTSPWILPQAREMALHDAREGTFYVETLREYAHCRDRNEVARHLFIHPNTASYRIRRCRELFGIDLQDDNLLARMLVSFALMRIEGV